jgi:hypothetical protein
MNRNLSKIVLACVALVFVAGCAGKPQNPQMVIRGSDNPHSTNPNRIVCRQLPPPTGSHISQDEKVCHTWAQWKELEKRSQEAVRFGQRRPGSANSPD